MNLLVFRPDYEELTHYVSSYLDAYVVGNASKLGFKVLDLYKDEATAENFFANVEDEDVVVFGTHGLEDKLFGQNGQPVLTSCLNDQALSGKICFALACRSASKLGYSSVDKGCLAYFGWLQDFVIIIDESYENPLDDPYAGSFLRPVINGINTMLSSFAYGRRVEEIVDDTYNTVVEMFNQEIEYWKTVETPTASQMVTYLYWDRDHFIPIFEEAVYVPTPVYVGATLKGLVAVGLLTLPLLLKST